MTTGILASAAILGMLAVLFGAFGAHRLKRTFSESQLNSFETGVKYQFYHSLLLLILGLNLELRSSLETWMVICFLAGTILFSFSIYILCLMAARGKKLKYFGLATPLGGLLLVVGWGLLLCSFIV